LASGIEWSTSEISPWTIRLLFLIYIKDLGDGITNWILKLADDNKICGRVDTLQEHTQLQDDLNTLLQWTKDWQMLVTLLNVKSCILDEIIS